jgi:carboxypeptidase Taq
MRTLGFDFEHGRLDESAHPFCGGVPDDVRMTARYDESDAASGLMAILHETGHALYNAGLPKAWRGQPVGRPLGMVAHESQSLLLEMQVCRSRAFFGYLAPLLRETFGRDGEAFAPDNLYRQAIQVARGFIRVDADEVTYPLHVILRYRLEKALLADDLPLGDLPGAWNEGMRELLGITPPDDRLGCLQDIHWPGGAIAYFPCYTLGALMAAQLFQAIERAAPEALSSIPRGDFRRLLAWLRANIHEQGSLYATQELLTRTSGRPLELQPFLDHLHRRYLDGGEP